MSPFTPPSFTASSNAGRYISRRVRSSTTESTVMRLSSCELTAKCFTHAYTPCDCMPRMSAAAILPASSGSSEKYSKFRPQRGLRLMFTPGPSTMEMPSAFASRPMCAPISSSSASSHVLASPAAVG